MSYSPTRDILTRATGFMDAYDFTLNPYSGCSFGCSYCYAAFFSTTADERDNWGKWVRVKDNAIDLMRKKIKGKHKDKNGNWKPNNESLIYMSSVTDPYQPIERRLELTRGLLKILASQDEPPQEIGTTKALFELNAPYKTDEARHKPKLVVQTRSPDVVRDVDLFQQIEANGGRVQVNMTVTTDDEDIRRTFEPFCPSNMARLKAIGEVSNAGVQTCITMTPLLLVSQPYAFVESLLDTGVEKFIAQPFHFARGKFVASTRERAFDMMAEKLGCARSEFQRTYMEHYDQVFAVLRDGLPNLGEGKGGFKPPFQ
ncbi:MAG: radical SAM protein [Chloroflexi bacterium]|nr:radical SAM protein [Chloroflexota bacterium]